MVKKVDKPSGKTLEMVKVRSGIGAKFCSPDLIDEKDISEWTESRRLEIAREVCMRMSTGEPLTKICPTGRGTKGRYSDMPLYREWLKWVASDEKIAKMVSVARIAQVQIWVDESMEISESPLIDEDFVVPESFKGLPESTQGVLLKAMLSNELNRRKMLIDTRKWFASSAAGKLLLAQSQENDDSFVDIIEYD